MDVSVEEVALLPPTAPPARSTPVPRPTVRDVEVKITKLRAGPPSGSEIRCPQITGNTRRVHSRFRRAFSGVGGRGGNLYINDPPPRLPRWGVLECKGLSGKVSVVF